MYNPTPNYYNDYLCHYGVLGMKWGVRKRRNKPLSKRRIKRVEKLEKYRDKKIRQNEEKVSKYKQKLDYKLQDIDDLKRYGVKSRAYDDYVRKQFSKETYTTKHNRTRRDDDVVRITKNSVGFFTKGLSLEQVIGEEERNAKAYYNIISRGEQTIDNLMGLTIDEFTKKKHIKKMILS